MKVPKIMRTYCPKCKTHTEFQVSLYKAGKRWALRRASEDKRYASTDTVDKNSLSSTIRQKSQRNFHSYLNAKNAAINSCARECVSKNWR